jgi:hypothetical protein
MGSNGRMGVSRRLRSLGLAAGVSAALVAALPAMASASTTDGLVNPGFESGDTAGWSGSGSVTSQYDGYTAPDGKYFAVVNGGCYTSTLAQSFVGHEGQTLTGWAFFKANDYLPYNDSGAVQLSVDGAGTTATVFSSSIGQVGSYGATPWQQWSYTFPADGQYTIAAHSTNAYDCAGSSAVGIDLQGDSTPPTITASATSNGSPYTAGTWTNNDVAVHFTCVDDEGGSGVASTTPDQTVSTEGDGQSVSGDCTDNVGNTASASFTGIRIDKTAPAATFDAAASGVSDGATYPWDSTPAAPTCTATDATSGPDGCIVTGYSTTLGTHTLTATAKDQAGNTGSSTLSYTVAPWRTAGFSQPVDMGGVLNTVKNGSTVPVKFKVYAGDTEVTDTSKVAFSASKVSCTSGAGEDALETVATGGTALRYDATAAQFVYNWATPKVAGACYALTMTTADSSTTTALFKLK